MYQARVVFTGGFSGRTSVDDAQNMLAFDKAQGERTIHSFAVVDGWRFAAVLEGAASEVLVAFTAIARHPGIKTLKILGRGPALSLLFPQSRCVDVGQDGAELALGGLENHKQVVRMLWNISAPGILIGAPRAA